MQVLENPAKQVLRRGTESFPPLQGHYRRAHCADGTDAERRAVHMNPGDLKLLELLTVDDAAGTLHFAHRRMLLFDADAAIPGKLVCY